MRGRTTILAVLTVGLPGCDLLDDPTCPGEPDASVIVEVHDSVTGAPAAAGATGELRMGPIVAILIATSASRMENRLVEDGPWEVRIQKTGYQTWVLPDVHVGAGRCGPRTTNLQARLQPQ